MTADKLRAKRAAFASLACAAVAALAATPADASPTPAPTPSVSADARAIDLLRAAFHAEEVTSFVAQVETIRFGAAGSVATIVREDHLAPDETHKIYLAPQDMYGDSVIVHGVETYEYDTQNHRVVISHGPNFDAQTMSNGNFALLLNNYRPLIAAPEIIAGRPTIPCSLVNRYTGVQVIRVWIDAGTRLILQKETYHSDGTIGSRTQFESVRYTSTFPAALFETPIPAGFRVVEDRAPASTSSDLERVFKDAGFAPAGPRYLPEGFTILSADVTMLKGVKTLHLLYSDGVRSLSLFENAQSAAADFRGLHPVPTKIQSRDALYVNDGPTTFLSWKNAGLTFALVGDLDLRELKAIAASVS